MAMTIEEQFELLRESILSHINRPDDDRAPCSPCDTRARALVMAAVEEAFARHHPHTCGIWAAQFNDEFRARIAALGGKDGS